MLEVRKPNLIASGPTRPRHNRAGCSGVQHLKPGLLCVCAAAKAACRCWVACWAACDRLSNGVGAVPTLSWLLQANFTQGFTELSLLGMP